MDPLEKWTTNESLLQSYRQIFIGSQSFLLAVGAILAGKGERLYLLALFLLAGIGWFMIWAIWFPVVRARFLVVDYYKYQLAVKPGRRKELCSEHEYVHDRRKRRQANRLLGIGTNYRETRLKIDLLLPILFSLIWLLLSSFEAGIAFGLAL